MARLASIAKAGYYPTPGRVTEWIANHLRRESEGGRLLDPCAGEGDAASSIAQTFHLESYGVELDYERATQASYKMDHIIADDIDMAKISREAFELLWLNAPYDVVQGKRLEYKFLTHCTQFLAPNGILVYIVPHYIIGAKVAGYLARNYHSLRAYRFPDPEHADFRQIVVFGIKRAAASDDTAAEEEALHRACAGTLPILPETPDENQQYLIPAPHAVPDFYFYAKNLSDTEVIALMAESGACTTQAWQEHFDPETELDSFRPLMRLKQGHLISLIAAGYIQNIRLERQDESILVKGRTYKKQVENEDEETKRVTDTFVTELVVLDLNTGEFEHIDDTSKLAAFSEKWNSLLLQQVLDSYPPVYNMDYETALPAEKVQLLNSLSSHRRLPRRNICGLFEAQKHVATALYSLLQKQKNVVLVGEMSTGKTTMGTALAALMGKDANPVFVMCPAHLVAKWKREILEILPGAYVDIVERIADVARFARTVQALPPERMAFAICSKEMAKLGSGTEPAYIQRQQLEFVKKDAQELGAPLVWQWIASQAPRWIEGAEGADGEPDAMRDTERAKEEDDDEDIETAVAPRFLEQAYLESGHSYEPSPESLLQSLRAIPNVPDGHIILRERIYCAHCGAEARDAQERLVAPEYFENKKRFCSQCRSPFFQMIHLNQRGKREMDVARLRTIRYPIAEFIRRNLRGFFGLFLADEVHEAKGHSTDVGYALSALEQACRHTLGMTGTLYGGYCSTLFSLLYRLDPKIPPQYRWHEMQRFIARYGILEEVTFKGGGNVDDEDEFGVYTAKRRSRTYVRERPGISPELIVRLLNYTAFVQLADLGYDLVPLTEYLVELDLAPDHREEYAKLQLQLENALEELRESGQSPKRLLSAYLQSLLGYVNSGHREEIVRDPHGDVIAVAKGLGEDRIYPKEEQVLRISQENVMQGRGVIVYLRQTGTRDISERLRKLIAHAGLPVAVLKSSISSTKREAWIAKQVQNGVKVLITNMELVRTGLDLIDFPTMIYAEPNYSAYTMQQALRRPLRLTQVHDVRAYYLVYRNTMESAAVSLIMEKVAAAVKVNGDSLEASLMASQSSADDVLSRLAKVLQGTAQVKDLHELFREKEREAAARRAQESERLRATASRVNESAPVPMTDPTKMGVLSPTSDDSLEQVLKTPELTTGHQATLF